MSSVPKLMCDHPLLPAIDGLSNSCSERVSGRERSPVRLHAHHPTLHRRVDPAPHRLIALLGSTWQAISASLSNPSERVKELGWRDSPFVRPAARGRFGATGLLSAGRGRRRPGYSHHDQVIGFHSACVPSPRITLPTMDSSVGGSKAGCRKSAPPREPPSRPCAVRADEIAAAR